MSTTVLAPALAGQGTRRPAPDPTRLARLVRADVLDRIRRPGYIVSLLIMVWIAQHMLPENGASYRTFAMDDQYRPVYNAAWVGTLTALLTGMWFLFIGFYLVKGSVERDRRTGVGQVIAATRVRTRDYLWARALGNLAIFASQTAVVAAVALAQQQLLGEDRRVDLAATLLPYLAFTLPAALFTAAAAVLFDCIAFLRGGLGNVAWFFLLGLLLVPGDPGSRGVRGTDFTGARAVARDVRAALNAAHPESADHEHSFSMGVNLSPRLSGRRNELFEWRGMRWTWAGAAERLPLVVLAVALVLTAAFVFDRFEAPARAPAVARRTWWQPRQKAPAAAPARVAVRSLTPPIRGHQPLGVMRSELALLLKGVSPWWWLGFLGLWAAQLAAPLEGVRTIVLPLASFWPALLWSALGTRERAHDTGAVLFSCPHPVVRLLPAAWLAGAAVMLLAGAPALLRLTVAGAGAPVLGWLLGAALVPAAAIACGSWSGGRKLFEVLYLFIWYVGPMHQIALLDYTGVTAPRSAGLWIGHASATLACLVLAWLGRRQEMRR